MKKVDSLKESDPDLANAEAALKRAAYDALKLALQTGTPFYVYRDGKIIDLRPQYVFKDGKIIRAQEAPPDEDRK